MQALNGVAPPPRQQVSLSFVKTGAGDYSTVLEQCQNRVKTRLETKKRPVIFHSTTTAADNSLFGVKATPPPCLSGFCIQLSDREGGREEEALTAPNERHSSHRQLTPSPVPSHIGPPSCDPCPLC